MKFISLKMFGFRRFPLRDIEIFEHEFNSKLLMICGPNGAGKSSLFNELTPLPSDKNDFYPGGYKEIKIEKDNKIYKLTSDFIEGTKFSFMVDDEELNTAGIVTAQRELVAQHFKITPTIHDIMIGRENFTDMSLQARKKLFSAITHLNIDKVLEGYNKLKEQHKTNTALLKSLTASYLIEEQKLIDKDRIEALTADLEQTKNYMDQLLDFRTELQRYAPPGSDEECYKQLMGTKLLAKVMVNANSLLLTSYPLGDLDRLSKNNATNLALVTDRLNTVYHDIDKCQSKLRTVAVNGANNRQGLLTEKERLEHYIAKIKDTFKIFKDTSLINESTQMALYKVEAALPDILRNLQTNIGLDGERIFTTERYTRTIEEKRRLVESLQQLNALEISIKHNLTSANDATGDVECPKCSHTWPLKEALTASIHAKEELEDIHAQQIKIRAAMASVERSIEELTEYFTMYKQYTIIKKETLEILAPFWESVDSKELIFSDPTSILSVVNLAGLELSYMNEINNAYREIGIIDKKLETITFSENIDTVTVRRQLDNLNDLAIEMQENKRLHTEEAKYIERAKSIYDQLGKIQQTLNTNKKEVINRNIDLLISSISTVVDDEIRNLRINYINIEKELHQTSTVQYTLSNYQRDIDDTKENIKVLDLALTELCPKSGLIAKSVSSFLNTIISNVNSVIRKIWEYKMILRPIDVDNDSLNYKFKVEVEDKLTIGDVSSCSSGMQEIINLSFKMTLYRLLGLEGYPIFLDEFGSKLDVIHRSKVFSIIFGMISDPFFSQIFMITHIDTSIANFKDVEVLEI